MSDDEHEVPPDAPAEERRARSYVRVPTWVVALVGVVVLAGGGFALGRVTAPDESNQVTFELPGGEGRGAVPLPRIRSAAFLGVATRAADGTAGVEVTRVSGGSPADRGGLQTGDVITEVDGEAIEDPAGLRAAILAHDPGDEVTITYSRDGSSNEVTVELGDRAPQSS